jgi:pilT protein domain protein
MSVITIAELLGNANIRGNHIPKQERHRRIKAAQAWLQAFPITSVEADSTLAFEAGTLAQQHQLKGPDALILASSLRVQAKTLYTWDNGLLKINGKINNIDIVKPSAYQYSEQATFSFDDLRHA